ncbi:MAG: hypothetical protein RSA57_03655 [Cetobacterium sp.]|uniref:hypothetical protein n=1 Tax=Bacteria TaxID=2 RepID=UPI002FC93CF1
MKNEIEIKVIKSNIITCYSPEDAFLTAQVASEVALTLSKVAGVKTLIIDLNNINPMIDHFLAIDKKLPINDKYEVNSRTSLAALVSAIDRGMLTPDVFKKLVIKHEKYNLDIATGLYDLLLDDKVEKAHYEEIINLASSIYDLVIISTNSYLKATSTFTALTKATKVVIVTKDNYTSVRNIMSELSLLRKKVDKDKFNIVIYENNNGLRKEIMEDMISEYKILGYVENYSSIYKAINEQKIYLDIAPESVIDSYNKIAAGLGYEVKSVKKGFLQRIKGKVV